MVSDRFHFFLLFLKKVDEARILGFSPSLCTLFFFSLIYFQFCELKVYESISLSFFVTWNTQKNGSAFCSPEQRGVGGGGFFFLFFADNNTAVVRK